MAAGQFTTVSGGNVNKNAMDRSTIAGGYENRIDPASPGYGAVTISGGGFSTITGGEVTVGGGDGCAPGGVGSQIWGARSSNGPLGDCP